MTSSLQLNEVTHWSVTGFVLLSQLSTTDAHDRVSPAQQYNTVLFMHHLLSPKFKPFICRFVAGYFILYWSHWEKLSTAFDPALGPVPWQECYLCMCSGFGQNHKRKPNTNMFPYLIQDERVQVRHVSLVGDGTLVVVFKVLLQCHGVMWDLHHCT